jgi:opacity protein-like surface antigen
MRRHVHLAVVFASALAAAPALAADYAAPSIDAPTVIPIEEIGTGWYLRGDINYDKVKIGDIKAGFPGTSLSKPHANSEISYGGGLGYKLNEWFRFDVTADYSKRDANWSRTGKCYGFTCPQRAANKGEVTLIPILANAYVDLGNWSGLTPYVGAGIGFAVSSMQQMGGSWSTGTTTVAGASYSSYDLTFNSNSRASLAAAAMAGVSYDFGSGLQMDIGYRYLWVDEVKGGYSREKRTTTTNPDLNGNGGGTTTTDFRSGRNSAVALRDIGLQQLRVGFRYYVY